MTLRNQEKRKLRISYAMAFVLLLVIEVVIALFIHDAFIRPYIGDVLVVIVLYTAVRIFIPSGFKLMPLYIFIFSVFIECLQYFNLLKILGMQNNTLLRILVGSVFDIKDILCYGAGYILILIYEWRILYDTKCYP